MNNNSNVGPTIGPSTETLDTSDIEVSNQTVNDSNNGGMNKPPKKKSILPLIIIIILLVGGAAFGGYYVGAHVLTKNNNQEKKESNDNKSSDEKKSSEEKKDDEKKTDNKKDTKVEAGTDKNTSGKAIVDTKKKSITLNGQEYELKIEVLGSSDGTKKKYQNVYFNGYKFIADQVIYQAITYDESYYTDDTIEKEIKTELDNIKVFKDTANSSEYLVFSDKREAFALSKYLYFIKEDGTLLKKISIDVVDGMAGIYIESDSEDIAFGKNPCTAAACKKYSLAQGSYTLGDDYIYYISAYTCYSSEKMSAEVSKMVITNGKVVVSDYKTFESGEKYSVSVAGAQLCGSDSLKHEIN